MALDAGPGPALRPTRLVGDGAGAVPRADRDHHAEGPPALKPEPRGPRIVLVTALYDLARREPESGRRDPAFYFDKGEFVLSLDESLVVFTDPELEEPVRRRRQASGLEHRTRTFPIPLEELPLYRELPDIRRAASSHPIRNANPRKDTPLYTALGWSKVDFLEAAMAESPPGTTGFAWIDFGIAHVARTAHWREDLVFAPQPGPVRLLMMRNVTPAEVADRGEYYASLRGHVAGGFLNGGREELSRFCRAFRAEAAAALDGEMAPLEEQVLGVLVAEQPELFEPYYGDYTHILENFARPRGSAGNLLFQLRICRDQRDWRRACDIGGRIVASHRNGTFEAEPDVLSAILDEYFIAAWYRYHPRQDTARDVARYYAWLVESNPAFRDAFRRNEKHIRSNFSFLKEAVTPLTNQDFLS